jgi:hypothetical protein
MAGRRLSGGVAEAGGEARGWELFCTYGLTIAIKKKGKVLKWLCSGVEL